MKKLILLLFVLSMPAIMFAQMEAGAFNLTGGGYSTSVITDYQCIGINPANLGWTRNNNHWNIGFFEFTGSVYSEPLDRNAVYNELFNNNMTLTYAQKQQAAIDFTNKRMMGAADMTLFGLSYQDDKVGGFAFSIRQHGMWNSVLNNKAASFLFLGYNDPYFDSVPRPVEHGDTVGYSTHPKKASVVYQGTNASFVWNMDFNLGFGRVSIDKPDFKWYGGIDVRYIVAYAGAMYHQVSDGTVDGFSSLSPLFEVKYNTPTPSAISGGGMKQVGTGWGIDIATSFLIKDKLRIGLSLCDIGQVTYKGNVYEGRDVPVWRMSTAGINNYNIFAQGQLISADNPPGDSSMWVGLKSRKYSLPMNFRGGASYRIIPKVEVGLDFYVPITKAVPGCYDRMIFGMGCHYFPAEWVDLSLGMVTGGQFGTNMPLGVTFKPFYKETTWEIGFATRDVITFFNAKNPTVSGAFGFMRFSFGQKKSS